MQLYKGNETGNPAETRISRNKAKAMAERSERDPLPLHLQY